jgi:hypothetical protein
MVYKPNPDPAPGVVVEEAAALLAELFIRARKRRAS